MKILITIPQLSISKMIYVTHTTKSTNSYSRANALMVFAFHGPLDKCYREVSYSLNRSRNDPMSSQLSAVHIWELLSSFCVS